MADDLRTCTGECGRELPLSAFGKDARLKSGHRAVCKVCDRKATAKRRKHGPPKPGALVLVPKFPAPPAAAPTDMAGAPDGSPTRPGPLPVAGTYAEAAEAFIAALEPPAGDADALLVRSLRGLAELADIAEHGATEFVVRDTTAVVAKLVAVQRELAATRAAKAKPAEQPAPSRPQAASY